MSQVKRIHRENRLGKLLNQPGGITVESALRKASENLESMRESTLSGVDERIGQIEAAWRKAGALPSPFERDEIYRLANEIHGVAGVFGLEQLGEAAFSLCDLIDHLGEGDRWSAEAVAVHLSALRLFRHPDGQLDGEAVLAGLHRIVKKEHRPGRS
jgi:hypothetical protein